jgi:hypothetical protein
MRSKESWRESVADFERLRIGLDDGWPTANVLVHDRLCECRLVKLVVTVSPVANQLDGNVATKLLPILSGNARNMQCRLPNEHNRDS